MSSVIVQAIKHNNYERICFILVRIPVFVVRRNGEEGLRGCLENVNIVQHNELFVLQTVLLRVNGLVHQVNYRRYLNPLDLV